MTDEEKSYVEGLEKEVQQLKDDAEKLVEELEDRDGVLDQIRDLLKNV
jgi:hypothetical protein